MMYEKELRDLLFAYVKSTLEKEGGPDRNFMQIASQVLFRSQFILEVELPACNINFIKGAEAILHYATDELMGKKLYSLFHDKQSLNNMKIIIDELSGLQQPHEPVEYRCKVEIKSSKGDNLGALIQIKPFELEAARVKSILLFGTVLGTEQEQLNPTFITKLRIEEGQCYSEYVMQRPRNALFSDREIEILELLGKGYSSKQIAEELYISINTVNNHRANLLEKSNCKNTVELLTFSLGRQII